MAAADDVFEATYVVGGVDVTFRYGDVFHPPGALWGAVMIPTQVGPKFVGCYRRHPGAVRWRRLGKQWNDPVRAIEDARGRLGRRVARREEQGVEVPVRNT